MSRRMCSGSPSGVGPPSLPVPDTVQPSYPGVCNFLNTVCPPGTIGSSSDELLLPEGPVPQVLGKAGLEQIGRLDDVGVT